MRSLHPGSYLTPQTQQTDTGATLREDPYSTLYYDFDDERYSREHWEDIETTQTRDFFTPVSGGELEERIRAQRSGGLEGWNYDSLFADVSVQIDNVNNSLGLRFLEEANTALDQVISDITSRVGTTEDEGDASQVFAPLSCLRTFVMECLLEKLRYVANFVLHQRRKAGTTKKEVPGMLILHILCASYNEPTRTVCDPLESGHLFQIGLSADRYHDLWSALEGSEDPRAAHDYSSTGWSRSANRATTLITELEAETAAINRDLLYVPKATVFSLDDDHFRMASCSVVELTYLKQHKNPMKGLGPVWNAICSALNPFCRMSFHAHGRKAPSQIGEVGANVTRGVHNRCSASYITCHFCYRPRLYF